MPQGLSAQQRDTRRKKQEAVRNEDIVKYDIFEANQTYHKDAIVAAHDETYFDVIRGDLLGFTHLTVNDLLEHLKEQCLAMTFEKKRRELKEINLRWEHQGDIRVFLSNVQKLKEQLEDEYGIEWADNMLMTHVVAELCDSNVFTEE